MNKEQITEFEKSELGKAIRCLRLEVDGSIADSIMEIAIKELIKQKDEIAKGLRIEIMKFPEIGNMQKLLLCKELTDKGFLIKQI